MAKTELSDYIPQEFLDKYFERKGEVAQHCCLYGAHADVYRSNIESAQKDVIVFSIVRSGESDHSDRRDWYIGQCDGRSSSENELFIRDVKQAYHSKNRIAGKNLPDKIKELFRIEK